MAGGGRALGLGGNIAWALWEGGGGIGCVCAGLLFNRQWDFGWVIGHEGMFLGTCAVLYQSFIASNSLRSFRGLDGKPTPKRLLGFPQVQRKRVVLKKIFWKGETGAGAITPR